ncbi:MAG: Gfo/Idh/MocA family oxidoreductase [Planctomycetes bacterium]|nr:Gfo/Idh/MocA family oxidoreductase [Planctomycetota bacterium]
MKRKSRREFLRGATTGAAGVALGAAGWGRVLGANDRIAIGMIGCGSRGVGAHMAGVHKHDKGQNVEFVAVADPWRPARERAAALAKEWYGREPKQFGSYRDVVGMKEVDAVMIASCDHQHTTHLAAAAKAKKDVYIEKPLAMTLESLKAACDAAKEAGIVVQNGTQLRSTPAFTGCRELFRTGVLGKISRIEQCRNGSRPYWYGYLKEAKEEDVDWREFLMDRPMRPFNAVQFTGWYGFREFSDGPVPGLGSHFIDLVHYITGAKFPTSVVCHGGTFIWKDEKGFTCPDHVQATWVYPEGFMVHYSTNFGNGSGNSLRIFGEHGVMNMVNWNAPTLSGEGAVKKGKLGKEAPVEPVPCPDHFLDWLQCLRSRKAPNASLDAGYQHAVAVIMAMKAFDTGRRQVYDSEKRELLEK